MRVFARTLAAAALVTTGLTAAAGPVKPIQFTEAKLKNGLRVVIAEDHSAPIFAIAVQYNVGSR